MRFLTRTITIIIEVAVLILSIIWYVQTKEVGPLIGIVSSGGAFLLSIITKFTTRPRIVLHHKSIIWGRSPKGYTDNNPPIIRLGIDNPEQYWQLDWKYDLEIRNNSSLAAYNIEIEYENLPDKTSIEGEIGKIEPIQPHELRNFKIKLIQNVTGTHIEADKYLNENEHVLTKKFIIKIKYSDETGFKFRTNYIWRTDENQFRLF